jgi:hypothetical protein
VLLLLLLVVLVLLWLCVVAVFCGRDCGVAAGVGWCVVGIIEMDISMLQKQLKGFYITQNLVK